MKTWLVDFEFQSKNGRACDVWCMVARCVETGEEMRLWLDGTDTPCPFSRPFRLVAHYALAELACFRALGWPEPDEVIDTLAEARTARGQVPPRLGGWGLLAVADWTGAATVSVEHKDAMRDLALQDSIPTSQRSELMDYCASDVDALESIWRRLLEGIHLPSALIRGRALKAFARVESRGIPADADLVQLLTDRWPDIKTASLAEARNVYPGVFTPGRSFSSAAWLNWCQSAGIHWPTHASGAPKLDKDTFRQLAERYTEVRLMAATRAMLGQARKFEFPLGQDGRLRCMLAPFGSDTGRNQPSNSSYIFGASAWMRSVIRAPEGRVLAYVDFSSQEFALGGALAGDPAMLADYLTGDPYISFARRAGAVPDGASKSSHPRERATFKIVALAVQYGMGERSLANDLGVSLTEAERLIRAHQSAYPRYWLWRRAVIDTVMTGGTVSTRFGWRRCLKPADKANSIGNFLIQSTGADILRVAITALEEAGHRVIAPVHDAVLVEMEEEGWEEELTQIRALMARASLAVAPEVEIRTDFEITMPGEHFRDARGDEIWKVVASAIGRHPHPQLGT